MQLLPTSILSHLLTSYRGWTFQRDMMIIFTKYVVSTYCSNGSLSFLLLNFFKDVFIFNCVCTSMCVQLHTRVCMPLRCRYPQKSKVGNWSPRAGITGNYQLPDMGAENQTCSSVRAQSLFNCEVTSPALSKLFYSLIILFFYTCLTE